MSKHYPAGVSTVADDKLRMASTTSVRECLFWTVDSRYMVVSIQLNMRVRGKSTLVAKGLFPSGDGVLGRSGRYARS